MNKVFLIGNLTRDPELTETQQGVAICRFGIAVNRRGGASSDGERKADFYNVTAWRGLGETVARYAKKGNKVAVLGNIELRTYEDKEGVERMAVDIIAQDVEFLTPRGNSSEDVAGGEYPAASGAEKRKASQLQPFDDDNDKLPF